MGVASIRIEPRPGFGQCRPSRLASCHVFFHNLPAAGWGPPDRSVPTDHHQDEVVWTTACETAFLVHGHFREIAGPRSTTSSTPTRSRPACRKSWPRAALGPEAGLTYCAPRPA